jgi:hypothetical protein
MRRTIAMLAAFSIGHPAIPAGQQSGSAGLTIRSSVDLVLIDVRVTGKSGKPILGLKPEQFSVTEDGHPQKISSFDYNNIEAVETADVKNARPIVVPMGTVPAPKPEAVRAAVRDTASSFCSSISRRCMPMISCAPRKARKTISPSKSPQPISSP